MLFPTAVWKHALLCGCLLLLLRPHAASAFNVRLTWQPVVGAHGYRLYVATGVEGYGAPTDLGALGPDPDGRIRHVQTGLTASAAHRFAITSYDDGGESPRSNELTLAYAIVAPLLDSDDDGLSDAVEDVNLDGVTNPGETDRLRFDTDGDGISDGAERANGTDPLDPGDPGTATGTCDAPLTIAAGGGTYVQTAAGPSALAGSCAPSGGPEKVFRWTPAVSGRATIETCSGTGTSFDTVLYLRRGDCADGTEVACNDDTATCMTAEPSTYHGSRLQPLVAAGEAYFIVVDGDDAGGTFTLRVIAPEPPTATPVRTASATGTRTPTPTRTVTPTRTRTPTPIRTATRTPTPIRTATRTPTPIRTATPPRTATPIRTAAATESPTPTPGGAPLETARPNPLPTADPVIDATAGWYRCHRARAGEDERTRPIAFDAGDGFGPIAGTVRRLRALCPALPTVEPSEASPPLARYTFRQNDGTRRPFEVGVANVLGETLLAVGRTTAIHVLAAGDDTEPSVAGCRRVLERDPAPPRLLAVRTAENVERYVVGAPQRLCTAEAREPDATNGHGALLCYQARRERDPAALPLDEPAPVENVFGVGGTALQPVAELCVPTEIVGAAPAD